VKSEVIKKGKKPSKEELEKKFQAYLDFLSKNQHLFSKPLKSFNYDRFTKMKL
jgi:hypothetical protein